MKLQDMNAIIQETPKPVIIWPVQCSCGHLFLEKYLLPKSNDNGEVGFCWCGFCRTRLNVRAQTWE